MNKTLIVYYSLFQNTANLALEIAIQTGGTIRELIPDKNYSFDYNTAAKEVRNQISRGFCPKLISGSEPIDDYQTIFVGSPNWFKTLAPPVMSFLKQHNFEGKTVIPFSTSGGSGIENSVKILKETYPSINFQDGKLLNEATQSEVDKWISNK